MWGSFRKASALGIVLLTEDRAICLGGFTHTTSQLRGEVVLNAHYNIIKGHKTHFGTAIIDHNGGRCAARYDILRELILPFARDGTT